MSSLLTFVGVRGVILKKNDEYAARTERLLEPMMKEHGFELVDVEYVKEGGNWFLRAYIDKDGGITINDCELINRALSDRLDEEDFIEDSYILEVSSPGLGRPLKKDKDFKRNLGKKVEVKLYRAVDGCKEFEAVLVGYGDSTLTLQKDGNEEPEEFSRNDISMIRLAFE